MFEIIIKVLEFIIDICVGRSFALPSEYFLLDVLYDIRHSHVIVLPFGVLVGLGGLLLNLKCFVREEEIL